MKETLGKILRIFTTVLMVLSICMMIFTVISVLTFNRSDRQLFGYRAFIVLSDSMSATDFKAGDLVPATLIPPRSSPATSSPSPAPTTRTTARPSPIRSAP